AYNEEGQLLSITRNQNGTQTLAYEYAYGWDGGRRSRKDHLGNVWTWFPCGVACGAGDLLEEQSDLTGATWVVSATYLSGQSIVRRNSEFHHWDNRGTAGVITDGSGNVLSNNLYDLFRVQRYSSGSAQTPRRWRLAQVSEEGLTYGGGAYTVNAVDASDRATFIPPSGCFPGRPWYPGCLNKTVPTKPVDCSTKCGEDQVKADVKCWGTLILCLYNTPWKAPECIAEAALCEGKAHAKFYECLLGCLFQSL
ncbi:MAG: hypothetical protein LC772_01820, partial [Chloroflexi bacterium]|nr:hypothetical protein [Chloroflexota bacterium]